MDFFVDILTDAALDTLRLIPFLFLTYLAMEAIEHKAEGKTEEWIERAGSSGPFIGALLGAFPQCGFSAAASTLYAGRVISLGTLFAVYLATSDEMLPILIAEQEPMLIVKILGAKVIIGMVMGFIVDAVMRLVKRNEKQVHIHELCEQEHCDCEDGIFKSAVKHTLHVVLFIFLISLVLGGIIEAVGEDVLGEFLAARPMLSVFASCLVGLIPNCAASVVITELFLEGTISTGAMMGGLLTGAGIGLLVLFRANRPMKQNLLIVAMLWAIGVAWGACFDALGIVFV